MGTGTHNEEVFWECIVNNREICNGCFRKIRSINPPPPKEYLKSPTLQLIVTETVSTYGEGKTEWLPPKTGRYGEFISASRPQIICNSCGVIDGFSDPKSKGQTIKDGRRILDHLVQMGYEVDWELYFDTIRSMKSSPNQTGNDLDILSFAVSQSLVSKKEEVDESPKTR